MGWLALLRALLGLSRSLATYLERKQLLDAGKALAVIEGLNNAEDAIKQARDARDTAVSKYDSVNGLPDDKDPNLRD